MTEKNIEYIEIDLKEIGKSIWLKKTLILLVATIFVVLAFVIGKKIDKKEYTISAKFIVNEKITDGDGKIFDLSNVFSKDYQDIVTSNNVIGRAAKDLKDVNGVSSSQIKAKLKATSFKDTRIVTIYFSDSNKQLALEVIKAVRDNALIEIGKIFKNVDISFIDEPAIFDTQSSLSLKKIVLLAALSGVMLPMFFIALVEIFDNRIKNVSELKTLSDATILGVVPANRKDK